MAVRALPLGITTRGLVCGGGCDSGPCHLLLLLRESTKTLGEFVSGVCGGSNPGLLQRQGGESDAAQAENPCRRRDAERRRGNAVRDLATLD